MTHLVVLEKVLARAQQGAAGDLNRQFLLQFADECLLGCFAQVHAAAWQCPVRLACEAVKQQLIFRKDDCGNPELKPVFTRSEQNRPAQCATSAIIQN